MLEGLHISSGLWTPWDPPRGAGKCCWGEGRLDYFAGPVATTTWPRIRGRKWIEMDGWTTIKITILIVSIVEGFGVLHRWGWQHPLPIIHNHFLKDNKNKVPNKLTKSYYIHTCVWVCVSVCVVCVCVCVRRGEGEERERGQDGGCNHMSEYVMQEFKVADLTAKSNREWEAQWGSWFNTSLTTRWRWPNWVMLPRYLIFPCVRQMCRRCGLWGPLVD